MPGKCSLCIHKDREKIDKAILEGVPIRRIVAQFGASQGTIQRHKKHVSQQLLKAKNAEDLASGDTLLEQMKKINENANKLLDTAMGSTEKGKNTNPGVAIMAMREIRGQLALQLDIFKVMYDMKGMKEFQEEVISILDELGPKVKDKFLKKLKEKRGY